MPIDWASLGRWALVVLAALLVTAFRPLWPLSAFWPFPQLLLLALIAAMMLFRPVLERVLAVFMRPSDALFLGAAMLLAFGLAALANIYVLDGVPHVTDSVAYFFQAKVLATGHLAAEAPPCPECFLPHFFYSDGRHLISLFQPGWPALLAVGVLLGVPGLVGPVVGALSLWPLYRIVRRGFGRGCARLTVGLLMISPFFIYMNASFMSHSFSALLTLLALDQTLAWRDEPHPGRAGLAGLFVGLLALVRLFNAVLLGVLLVVLVLPGLRKRMRLAHLLLALLIALPIGSLQLAVNANLTGDAATFAQDEYFQRTERKPDCHKLGFGREIGCNREHSIYGFEKGYFFDDALKVTRQRLDSLALNLFGLPLVLWLALLPIGFGALGRTGRAGLLLIGLLVGGYMLFYYHGNCYGPRFYFEAAGPLVMLLALGLLRLDAAMRSVAARFVRSAALWKSFAPALALLLAIFTLASLHPQLAESYSRFRGVDDRLARIVSAQNIHNAVVLVPGNSVSYSLGFNYNNPYFNGDIVYAQHIWDHSVQLMYYYPDREFYRFEPRRDVLVKVRKQGFNGVIFSEMDGKFPPVALENGTAALQMIRRFKPENDEPIQMYFKGNKPGASFTVTQDIPESGDYELTINAMRGPYMGDWALEIDWQRIDPPFVGYATAYGFTDWKAAKTIRLEKGRVRLRFIVTGKDDRAAGYGVGLDWLTLRRVPDGLYRPVPRIQDLGYLKNGKIQPIGEGWIPWEKRPGWNE